MLDPNPSATSEPFGCERCPRASLREADVCKTELFGDAVSSPRLTLTPGQREEEQAEDQGGFEEDHLEEAPLRPCGLRSRGWELGGSGRLGAVTQRGLGRAMNLCLIWAFTPKIGTSARQPQIEC